MMTAFACAAGHLPVVGRKYIVFRFLYNADGSISRELDLVHPVAGTHTHDSCPAHLVGQSFLHFRRTTYASVEGEVWSDVYATRAALVVDRWLIVDCGAYAAPIAARAAARAPRRAERERALFALLLKKQGLCVYAAARLARTWL